MTISHQTVKDFGKSLRSMGKQPATVESYCRDAQKFLDFLTKASIAPEDIEADNLLEYQEHLRSENERSNSIRRTVIGVRQFYRYLSRTKFISESPFDEVPIPERNEDLPESLKDSDIETLIDEASEISPRVKGARDAALVAIFAYEGLKAGEMIGLRWSDFLEEKSLGFLKVPGSKRRTITLSKETTKLISSYKQQYKEINHPAIASSNEKLMFISFKGRDAATPLPKMTRHGIKFIFYDLAQKTGIKSLNTELLRHYAVSHMLLQGKTSEEIMTHFGLRRIGNIAKHIAKARADAKDSE